MKKSNSINIDRAVFLFGGIVILISVVLTLWVSQWWLILTAFVGLNMIQSAFTGFCPPAILFRKLGMPSGCAFKSKTE